MEDFDDEEELENGAEPAWTFPRLQFSLAQLLWVVTGAAVLCGLIAWWGAIPVLFLIGSAGGTFLGLLVCNYFGLGFAFENLRADLLKCVVIPAVPLGAWHLLMLFPFIVLPLWTFLIVFFLTYWMGMKFAWLDIEMHEIVLCCICTIFSGLCLVALVHSIFPLH
ncbi:MAG: hypothetical protein JXB10_13030 [Pirellulales bacterium]|nr:hypothetical protein [Pirellulales bacterium]